MFDTAQLAQLEEVPGTPSRRGNNVQLGGIRNAVENSLQVTVTSGQPTPFLLSESDAGGAVGGSLLSNGTLSGTQLSGVRSRSEGDSAAVAT